MNLNPTVDLTRPKRDRSYLDTSGSSEGSETSPSTKPPLHKKRLEMALTKADLDLLRANISSDMKEHLRTELTPLANQIAAIDSTVQRLERSERVNNIIIHGIPEPSERESSAGLVKLLEDLWKELNIMSPILIDNVYRLGRGTRARPILVKLVRNIDKQIIISKRKDAGRRKIYINDDLTQLQQFQKKLLTTHLQSLKASDPDVWGSIRGNSLHAKKAGHVIGRFEVRDGIVQETAQPML
jgi:hypothetical protein